MDRLEGIKIFVRVVESGSFSAVARELGTGQPAISKQVAALEERLGAQLLMRTSREPDRGRARFLRVRSTADQRSRGSRTRPRRLAWCASPARRASLAAMSCRNYLRSARDIPRS
jgi:DNA-binding transcriptional LysR family regulator